MSYYIHQKHNWPNFTWISEEFVSLLSEARNLQGRLIGKMESLGFELQDEALLETLTLDVLKSAEIEGELLNPEQVRSSIAQRLGMEFAGTITSDRNVDGMVDMMIDATRNCFNPLTKERLFDWHAALFPMGRSGIFKITVADWRKDSSGKMQVVSGSGGREKVHFQAPDADLIEMEMKRFLQWFNEENKIDLVIKAAIAHLWFVTIHPFQDGNGRLSRLLTNLLLLKSDYQFIQYVSFENLIEQKKKTYYEALMDGQKDRNSETETINAWVVFFLDSLETLIHRLEQKYDLFKSKGGYLNDRQKKILDFISSNQPIKLADLVLALPEVSSHTLKKDLLYLKTEQFIDAIGKYKGTFYIKRE